MKISYRSNPLEERDVGGPSPAPSSFKFLRIGSVEALPFFLLFPDFSLCYSLSLHLKKAPIDAAARAPTLSLWDPCSWASCSWFPFLLALGCNLSSRPLQGMEFCLELWSKHSPKNTRSRKEIEKNDGKTDCQPMGLPVGFRDWHAGFLYQENKAPRPRSAPSPLNVPIGISENLCMK